MVLDKLADEINILLLKTQSFQNLAANLGPDPVMLEEIPFIVIKFRSEERRVGKECRL